MALTRMQLSSVLLGILLNSFFAFAQSTPARVNCLDSQLGSSTITTLRSDVRYEYLAPSIKLVDSKGELFAQLHSLITLGGNNLSTQLYFLGKDQKGTWSLNFVDAKITHRKGHATSLAAASEPTSTLGFFESRKLQASLMATSKDANLVVFPSLKTNTYTVLNRKQGNLLNPLSLNVNEATNPRFSNDEKYLIFDRMVPGKLQVQQILVELASQKTLVIEAKAAHVLNAVISNKNIYWIELTEKNFGREKFWSLKAAPLDKSTQAKALVENLSTENDLVPPFTWIASANGLTLAFLEERYERNSNTGDITLKKGQLKIAAIDEVNLMVRPIESYPYSSSVSSFTLKFAEFGGGLQFARFHPASNSLLFAGGNKSGLVKFDLNTKNWSLHAAGVDLSLCFQPAIGDEVK